MEFKKQLKASLCPQKLLGINIPSSFKTRSFEDFDILEIRNFQTVYFSQINMGEEK